MLLHPDSVTLVYVKHGAPDEDGVPTSTTTRMDILACNVQPVDGSEVAAPDMETVTIRWRVSTASPGASSVHVGDRVEWAGTSYRVDEEPLHYSDSLGLLQHVEWFMRRWS